MLHLIFNYAAQLTLPWDATNIKPWIQTGKDFYLNTKLNSMNGKALREFVARYPQHFSINPDGSIYGVTCALLNKSSVCPHCRELAGLHQRLNNQQITSSSNSKTTSSSSAHTSTTSLTAAASTSASAPTFPLAANSNSNVNSTFTLIESWDKCNSSLQYIRQRASTVPIKIAVDCEGVELSKTGKLCLIQIAVLTPMNEMHTFIFGILLPYIINLLIRDTDIVSLEKLPQFKEACYSLGTIFQDPNIIKVMHDGRQDCSALYHQLSISVSSIRFSLSSCCYLMCEDIFDVQIAYRVLCELKRGTSGYNAEESKRMGLNVLLQKFGFPSHPLKKEIHERMNTSGCNFWTIRPLTDELIVSATKCTCRHFSDLGSDIWCLMSPFSSR